jgi:uncharacterized membrane protein
MINNTHSQKKKPLLELVRTSLIGGFVIVIPAYLGILILNKMIKGIIVLIPAFFKPIASMFGLAESNFATIFSIIIFLLICLISGLIVKSNYSRFFKSTLEPFFIKIPGYLLMRSVTNRMARIEKTDNFDVAFVALGETHESLSPALLIQKHSNGYYTAFVPAVPSPTVGAVYLVNEDKIFHVDVPILDMMKFITRWGEASPALLEAIANIDINKPISIIESQNQEILPEEQS